MEIKKHNFLVQTDFLDESKFDSILLSLETLYGNTELTKCLHEDDKVRFLKCSYQIIDNLVRNNPNLNDAFVEFFVKTIESFHNSNTCSIKTATIFSIYLLKRINRVKQMNGLDPFKISKCLKLVFEESIKLISLNKLIYLENIDKTFINKLSRNDEKISLILNDLVKKLTKYDIRKFELENVIIKCSANLKSSYNYNINSLNFRIKKGLWVTLDDENYSKFLQLSQNELKTLLFDSTLSPTHAHLGFNKQLNIQIFDSKINTKSYEDYWYERVTDILIRYEIKLVILKDTLDPRITKFCDSNKILIIKNFDKLNYFRSGCLSYVEDFDESKILNLKINILKNKSKDSFKCINGNYVNISSYLSDKFVSIILETRIENMGILYVEELRHNLKRLENVLSDGHFVNGNGCIEKYLSENIKMLKNESNDFYFDLCKEILENCYGDMWILLEKNCSNNLIVYDDFKSKLKAWQIAVWLNSVFLNSDRSIV